MSINGGTIVGLVHQICGDFDHRIFTEDEDFCGANVPEEWVPFDFNGKTSYVQPLSDYQRNL